jgi:hypothetical protein
MTDLDAGRALDERVARLVWPDPDTQPIWILPARFYPQTYMGPEFSTNREAAMTLLDALAERPGRDWLSGTGWAWDIRYDDGLSGTGWAWDIRYDDGVYSVDLYRPGEETPVLGHNERLPLAVCRAVLAALEDV